MFNVGNWTYAPDRNFYQYLALLCYIIGTYVSYPYVFNVLYLFFCSFIRSCIIDNDASLFLKSIF